MLAHIKKMIGDKKEYKEQMARASALPEDYKFVFEKIHSYIWKLAGGDGLDMLRAQEELIQLFENAAIDGRHVLEITGEDIAEFCDEFFRDTKKWSDKYRRIFK